MPEPTSGAMPAREKPPVHLVAAAEQDYHWAKDRTAEFTTKIRALLDAGWSDFDAVVDVYCTLDTQPGPENTMISAVALVQLAKTSAPQLGHPVSKRERA